MALSTKVTVSLFVAAAALLSVSLLSIMKDAVYPSAEVLLSDRPMSASQEWLKDRPELDKAIQVFHKYGDRALELLINKKKSTGMLLHSIDNAEDDESSLSAQEENMERLHAEAAAEIHVIREAEALQEGGGLQGLMRQERAALHSMGKLRRQTRLAEEELLRVPVAGGPAAARLQRVQALLRRQQARADSAARILVADRRRVRALARPAPARGPHVKAARRGSRRGGAAEGASGEGEEAAGVRPDAVEQEYLDRLRRRSRAARRAARRAANDDSVVDDSDAHAADADAASPKRRARGAVGRVEAGAVARENREAPEDGFDYTESRLKCLPCIAGRHCRAGCRVVRRP